MKNLRPQEIFFCSQSSQVLYSYFSSASLLCNPLSVEFFYVYWAPLCFVLSTAATSLEDNFLQALLEPIGWYPWSFQSVSTEVLSPLTPHPSGIHISFVDLPYPVGHQHNHAVQECGTESFMKDSIFTLFPIPLGHRQYSMKSWARKKSHIIQIIHISPSPLWWPMDWISFTRSSVPNWLFWGWGWGVSFLLGGSSGIYSITFLPYQKSQHGSESTLRSSWNLPKY